MDREYRRQRKRRQERARSLNNKLIVLLHYSPGGKKLRCSWIGCDVDDLQMLTLDHMNNDGAEQRRKIGRSSTALHRWLIKNEFPKGFRTLCASHNLKYEIQRRIKSRGPVPPPPSTYPDDNQ